MAHENYHIQKFWIAEDNLIRLRPPSRVGDAPSGISPRLPPPESGLLYILMKSRKLPNLISQFSTANFTRLHLNSKNNVAGEKNVRHLNFAGYQSR